MENISADNHLTAWTLTQDWYEDIRYLEQQEYGRDDFSAYVDYRMLATLPIENLYGCGLPSAVYLEAI